MGKYIANLNIETPTSVFWSPPLESLSYDLAAHLCLVRFPFRLSPGLNVLNISMVVFLF